MNIKLLTVSTFAASALLLSACGGAKAPANATTNATTNANKPTNAPANVPAANTSNTNTTSTANSTAAAPKMEGDVLKIEDGGIMMTIPKGFSFSKDGEDTVVMTEDKGVDVRFTVPKDGDYEKAVKDAANEIDDYIKDVKMDGKEVKGSVDGMETTSINGTGKDEDGKEVIFDLTIIKTPKKPVLAISYAEKSSMEKNATALDNFFKSVKKQ